MPHLDDMSSDEENQEVEMEEDVQGESGVVDESLSGDENGETTVSRVYLPKIQEQDTPLECDESAYKVLHVVKTGSPCLSFDIIPDSQGEGQGRAEQYPLTMTLIGGTQHEKVHCNNLLVMNLSNMSANKPSRNEDEESEEDDDSDDEDSKPVMEHVAIRHAGSVNRVKVTKINNSTIASSWSEVGKVFIWDLTSSLKALEDPRAMTSYIQNNEAPQPMFTFAGHLTEGFAMDWSPLVHGMLATGDCNNKIHLWKMLEGGSWHVDQRPYSDHTSSVEDIQWSPTNANVMASCSADKSIRIWDIRVASNKACMLTRTDAHDKDVNVMSWDKNDKFIVSGGDDGALKVWDLRNFPERDPICTFKYHTAPITSVEWHPTDPSVFAASGEDDLLTQWDLAVERDDGQENEGLQPELLALPPQLLFIHQGQKAIKELHWHKQMPGVLVSTSNSGLNVFRTISV